MTSKELKAHAEATPEVLRVLKQLVSVARTRENVMGDPGSYLAAVADVRALCEEASALIRKIEGLTPKRTGAMTAEELRARADACKAVRDVAYAAYTGTKRDAAYDAKAADASTAYARAHRDAADAAWTAYTTACDDYAEAAEAAERRENHGS